MKAKFCACSIPRVLITVFTGIALLMVVIQLSDFLCPCSDHSKIAAILSRWQPNLAANQSPSFNETTHNMSCQTTATSVLDRQQFSDLLSTEEGPGAQHLDSASSPYTAGREEYDVKPLQPYGVAAHVFVHVGSYRGSPSSFATVGLASKPLHVFSNPGFDCEWIPAVHSKPRMMAKGKKMRPDWGFGRVYTVVVVLCQFDNDVGVDSEGGRLMLHAYTGNAIAKPILILALTERKGHYNSSLFEPPYPYQYMYCGSPLYGNINPERMREWMTYHAWLLGPSSFFVLYDAGGVHPGVREVLDPWIKLGRVKIEAVQEYQKYDVYYYNQFLLVNDCLHKYRFMANWTFFFDVDEYIYIPAGEDMDSVLEEHGASQILIEQRRISDKLCLLNSENTTIEESGKWGMEKLVLRNVKKGQRWDRKYVIRARNAFSAGVHLSQNLVGRTVRSNGYKLRYYHYHGTISYQGELCREFVKLQNKNNRIYFEGDPYSYDGSMKAIAEDVKKLAS